jgi:spore coat protein CotH
MYKNIKAVLAALITIIIMATVVPGCAGSVSRKAYDPRVNPFTTDRVATVRLVMKEKDWSFCQTNAFEEQYVPADFWYDDELIPDIGVRTKGNSSLGQAVGWESPRMPLAVDFNLFNQARNFHGGKKVFLNNGWSDPTLIREVIAYEIFAEMDVPTPRATIVDLWVNDTRLGVYTMVEMVDQSFLRRNFADASGNLYKPEIMAARLDWTEKDLEKKYTMPGFTDLPHHDPVLYTNIGGAPLIELLKALGQEEMVSIYEPVPPLEGNLSRGLPPTVLPSTYLEAMRLKTNENNPDYSALFRFLDVLNNEPDETFPQEIEKVLDVDQTLRFIAVSALILHLDNYIGVGHNNYLYEVNGKFTFVPWDTNMAFGTFNMGIRKDGLINFYIDEPTGGAFAKYPVVNRLLSHQPYLDTYRGYMQELLDGPFALDVILPKIDRLVEMIRPYAKTDTEMFYSYEDWERCLTEDLRPPDLFEGWMAGGPSPALPWRLHREEISCLRKNFGVRSLYELFALELGPEELEILEGCLSEETYSLFLQNLFGPLMAPQPPRQPGFGPNSLGLKTFIKARHESVRQQLSGERPSGSSHIKGNNGSLWMADGIDLFIK